MRLVLFAAFLALAALAGCASISEDACRAGDWRGIGREDGAAGRGPERLGAHREACAKAGVVPDSAAWERGRQEGLRVYCTPARAYRAGREGRRIRPGCTTAELRDMRPAWERGREYWRLELEADDLRRDIRAVDRELARLPPGSPRRGGLIAERMMRLSRLNLLQMQQRRYARWP